MKVENTGTNLTLVEVNGYEYLTSYGKPIARKGRGKVVLDEKYYSYTVTTVRHRNAFLGKTSKEVDALIKSGEYTLADLTED